ncbi:ATP-binding cassette domain-containing protein [Noviherbaspirillum sp. CPCC 100848]|uniref:ATP-binding cassette domain-containing protein n=1 Tax=Noviherbaspirillum album TaxID=3080276 RepID=A0ABU6J6W4_9BURK|nr:ATP-binding cassette domain-containing protein [Noviherbaspirillum sp. CPCC 100848]MEC4719095.1 ATP-binding cassette domain-containing protein [Noviherbaspirillum sp. CPCC 100848]
MIEFRQVSKQYGSRGDSAGGSAALSEVSLSIETGELVYLSGPSGAGKSTLLKMIAAMERPSSGTISVNGQDIGRLGASGIPYLRRKLGLMFQPADLLNDRSVLANVMLPLLVTGASRADADKRARAALARVGLEDKAPAAPLALSGGEQQRVAIARAIVNRPQIILADEPTANLDRGTADKVMDALRAFHEAGVTCLIATHDESILQGARRVIRLEKGRVVSGAELSIGTGLAGAMS